MYRDGSTALDEHDRAVGAILIGEALIDSCDRAVSRIRTDDADADRWRAVAEVHGTYPEIWRHLDRARRVLADRGANTAAYDELRPHARRAPTHSDPHDSRSIDTGTLDDAKRAIDELKLAVPGADWDAIEARTEGLVRAPLGRRRRQRAVVAGVVSVFALAVVAWLLAIIPERKPDRHEAMRRELAEIQHQRKDRIETLLVELGGRCLPASAQELVKLLVLDGRGAEARELGTAYVARCGDDVVVDHWAHAPPPGH